LDHETLSLNDSERYVTERSPSRESWLTCAAWLVHFYTASGAIAGLIALDLITRGEYREAFIAMAVAIAIDSSDGPMARALEVRRRIPVFDGALLDNVVDYLNYVAVPAFLMIDAGLLPVGFPGVAVGACVMIASAYGFCRIDAKTADHYFRGFPSYWNLAAFYLFYLQLPRSANAIVIGVLAIMVFLPVKYIYPNRTIPLRHLTLTLAAIWAIVTAAMLIDLPARHTTLLGVSLAFIVYYFLMSFVLDLIIPRLTKSVREEGPR
jgi:phosphatidylcholine synthase